MRNPKPRMETPPAKSLNHRRLPPESAVWLLIREHGPFGALALAKRELRVARRARARERFHFWAHVRGGIEAHATQGR